MSNSVLNQPDVHQNKMSKTSQTDFKTSQRYQNQMSCSVLNQLDTPEPDVPQSPQLVRHVLEPDVTPCQICNPEEEP